MNNQKIPTSIGVIVFTVVAITIGVFIWKYKGLQSESQTSQTTDTITQQSDLKNNEKSTNNFQISNFDTWKTYQNEKLGIEIKYPKELYIDTSNDKVVFDYLSPEDPMQKAEGASLFHFTVSLQKKTAKQYMDEYQVDTLQDFKQKSTNLNGFPTEQITYTDVFAGGIMQIIFIQNGSDLIVIDYAGSNKLEDTFNRMLSTVTIGGKEGVSFCGKPFNVEGSSSLNGIDIVKRVAVLSQNNKYGICENITTNSPDGKISVSIAKQKVTDADYKDGVYFVSISVLNFKIDQNANSLYILSGFDGTSTFIGKLK